MKRILLLFALSILIGCQSTADINSKTVYCSSNIESDTMTEQKKLTVNYRNGNIQNGEIVTTVTYNNKSLAEEVYLLYSQNADSTHNVELSKTDSTVTTIITYNKDDIDDNFIQIYNAMHTNGHCYQLK